MNRNHRHPAPATLKLTAEPPTDSVPLSRSK